MEKLADAFRRYNLPIDGAWRRAAEKQGDTMEGNLVELDGSLYNLMRWKTGEILKLRIRDDDPNAAPEFSAIIPAPVSNSMFRVIPDGDGFLLVTNRVSDESAKRESWSYRNVLSIYRTKDFVNFDLQKYVVNREYDGPARVGFQFPSFIKEGNVLYLAIRSAFNSADNFHNSNHILFYETELNQ